MSCSLVEQDTATLQTVRAGTKARAVSLWSCTTACLGATLRIGQEASGRAWRRPAGIGPDGYQASLLE